MKTYSLRQLNDILEEEANEETEQDVNAARDADKRWYKYGAIMEHKTKEKRFILLSDLEKCIDIEVKQK